MNQTMEKNPFDGKHGGEGIDAMFVLVCSFIIFTMQSGFSLVESGMVSRRSQANVMVKNMVDVVVGGIAYWFLGYGFSFGPNDKSSKVMSGEGHFITDVELTTAEEAHIYTKYFFQLSFATTASTIVSGAVAERIKFSAYMIFVFINTGLIYAFPAHWMWDSNGWLYNKAFDFAGSAVVHISGGIAAFAGAVMLGPRHGKYKGDDNKRFKMACPTNVILGTFFLWWGWIGFNCGSVFSITGHSWRIASRVAVVTMNGAMAGASAIIILNIILFRWRRYLLDLGEFSAGLLGGLVSVTGGCNQIRPWEALVIGFIGGLVSLAVIKCVEKMKVDDPVGCVGVHWGGGVWGMVATGLFGMNGGVFRGGSGIMLAYNVAASCAVTLWCGGLNFILFAILRSTEKIGLGLRLSLEEEILGPDLVEHNITADDIDTHAQKTVIERKVSANEMVVSNNDVITNAAIS